MLQIAPYNPVTQDLFLYEPYTVSWTTPTAGSVVVGRAYAWNPDCILYGYRGSLEGLSIPYRNFSTAFGTAAQAPEVNAVNPLANPVNNPIWYNSYPPHQKFFSKRHLMWCAHAYGISTMDRATVTGFTAADMYAAGGYLDAMLVLRFLDKNNNAAVVAKNTVEYPYAYDAAAGRTNVDPNDLPVAAPSGSVDVAVSLSQSDFPFTPLTMTDLGSRDLGVCHYINAGNMTVQTLYLRSIGPQKLSNQTNLFGGNWVTDGYYDSAFTHDSGSSFCWEISPPSSSSAGDGVMGVQHGHIRIAPPIGNQSERWKTYPPPKGASLMANPSISSLGDWTAVRAYWTARGQPFPSYSLGCTTSVGNMASGSSTIDLLADTATMASYVA